MQIERPLDLSKFVENGGIAAKPLIIDGTIYIGAMDTYFYAIDAKTGKKKWSYKTNGPIIATAARDADAIYFGSFDHNLYALSFDGKLLWKFKTNGLIASAPQVFKGVVYFGSSDHRLYAVNTNTQQELWHFRTNDEIVSDPLIARNRMYFGSMDSYFYCLDLEGNLVWKFKANDAILMGSAASDDHGLYFGSVDETLYSIDFNGRLRWGFKTAEQVYNTAITHEGIVYFCGRDRYAYALNAENGACIWKFMSAADMYCPPLLHNNRMYFGSEKIYCLNMDGYKIWDIPMEDNNQIAMNGTVFKGNLIFSCFDCTLKSINPEGQLNWSFRTNGVLIPIEAFLSVLPAPKWDPHLFDPETVQKSASFNPYAFSADSDLKIYGGTNTTGIEAYVGERRDAGAYRRKDEYIEKNKKKKVLDEILEDQVKRQWGI